MNGLCVVQRYDVDRNGTIDVQEFTGLIFDAYTTGPCCRINCANHSHMHLRVMCRREMMMLELEQLLCYRLTIGAQSAKANSRSLDETNKHCLLLLNPLGELQHTLSVDKLSSWARKTENKNFAVGYFELDKWMSAMVGASVWVLIIVSSVQVAYTHNLPRLIGGLYPQFARLIGGLYPQFSRLIGGLYPQFAPPDRRLIPTICPA